MLWHLKPGKQKVAFGCFVSGEGGARVSQSPVMDSICQAILSKALCLNIYAMGTVPGVQAGRPTQQSHIKEPVFLIILQTQEGETPSPHFDSILVTEGDSEMSWDERRP